MSVRGERTTMAPPVHDRPREPTALRCRSVSSGQDIDTGTIERELETHRRELTGYCYRMLGSGFEAEDAVQETMLRAWRAIDRFEGRSSVRSWLYRIATNVCLDMLQGPQRRARPMDLGPSSPANGVLDGGLVESSWVLPMQDSKVLPTDGDPAVLAEGRETIRLAFVAALQHLPPRQRAVLILREVLRWQATEVAELLETTVASVNSALQRARASLDSLDLESGSPSRVDAGQQALLDRYVAAFERYDIEALVALIHEDAVQSMPPYAFWLRGRDDIGAWFTGQGIGCKGARLVSAGLVNGWPAFGNYRIAGSGVWKPFGIQLLDISGGRIVGFHNFIYPELFTAFGLPDHLEG